MSTPVNMGAVSAMGSQFNTNVFAGISHKAARTGKKLQAQANRAARNTPAAPTSNAGGTSTVSAPLPPNAAAAGRARRQARAQAGPTTAPPTPSYPTSPTPHAPGAGGAPVSGFNVMQGRASRQARAQQARTPANAVPFSHAPGTPPPTSRAAGAQGAPIRTNTAPVMSNVPSPTNPINRTAFNQPSTTPFSAPQSNVSSPTQFKAAPKPSTTPFSVGPLTTSPKPSATAPQASTNPFANKSNANAPAQAAQQQLSSQFANTKQGNNAPFPTHQHPSGSSNMILQNASAALSQPGRPNTLIVGSRNASPGGIAAAGSRLEAWANAKSSAVQARQESKRAGGRDRDLAAKAAEAENLSNQPLNRFAP